MVYFELIDSNKNSFKFWEIENYWNEDRPNVYVRWGKIGNVGNERRFYYQNMDWGTKYMQKQIESKVKKGYVQNKKKDLSKSKTSKTIKKKLVPSKAKPKKSVAKVDKKILKSKNKNTKSEALKIHDEVYKTWVKVAKKSKKLYGDEERLIAHPDGLVWGYGTSQKYTDWESCVTNSRPKQECNKIVTLLRKDLTEMNKALAKVDKTCPPGKVLSPSGRCVINKSKPTKNVKLVVKVDKTCPPGKVLSPKGRCVIDRSKPSKSTKSAKKPKLVVKKTCPPGKVFYQPLNICVIDRTKSAKKPKLVVKKTTSQPSLKLPKGKLLYDVKKQGVMLAHTFKDSKSGKIKTAPKGYKQAPNGWFLSEKYDGYRAIWNGKEFVSRNGNIFPSPPEFKKWLPTNEALDGELFMGREKFQKCGLFKKKEADCEVWKKENVTYQIFDSPTIIGVFEERISKIQKLIKEQCKKHTGKCPLILTKQIKVNTEEDVYKHFDKLVSKGAEGVMLRAPNSPYEKKRSNYLLKVKQLFDAECKIVGYKPGSAKYTNMLGAFHCELVKNKNIKFTISGMDDSIRQNYKKTHPIGTIVTFTYMGLSDRGVPRHPNYLRKRGKE